MQTILLEILEELRKSGQIDDRFLEKTLLRHNRELGENNRHYAKKKLLPYYLKLKRLDSERWEELKVTPELEIQLIKALQVKPRRTASGVATITVITKPWKCSSECIYCPNDVRMPKSYLSDEPACQRAERNHFDPYLQVVSRLRALTDMGHPTDKIELIVLGGTWSDYPEGYQIWFIEQLFKALNDGVEAEQSSQLRRKFYKSRGLGNGAGAVTISSAVAQQPNEAQQLTESQQSASTLQQLVNNGNLSYNQAVHRLYDLDNAWQSVAVEQVSNLTELDKQHTINETAQHRVVGLVIETRPDTITTQSLTLLRRLGCTKVQIGVQSLDPAILALNNRTITIAKIQEAFELLRVFGFKIHAHFMLNLYGATPEKDKIDYLRFVTKMPYQPDELKLYPCSLVAGTKLCDRYADTTWRPYSEEELLDVLSTDMLNTPGFVRVSRMIRDISAKDILVGNKKANLRQLVENRIEKSGQQLEEIRYREINSSETNIESLELAIIGYETTATNEHFLQWITPENKIVGFLRLSLPKEEYVRQHQSDLPISQQEAMIREVHVYGKAARLHRKGEGAQHLGLGRQLIKAASDIARQGGYLKLNVISSVGTREYYRRIGFKDNGLYQQISLEEDS